RSGGEGARTNEAPPSKPPRRRLPPRRDDDEVPVGSGGEAEAAVRGRGRTRLRRRSPLAVGCRLAATTTRFLWEAAAKPKRR
ncbi:hypothetical protein MKK55_25740, partial [Methylobacterium sp. J-059]|nr:hypothetical protein [Methylobacterium sp. J-059]